MISICESLFFKKKPEQTVEDKYQYYPDYENVRKSLDSILDQQIKNHPGNDSGERSSGLNISHVEKHKNHDIVHAFRLSPRSAQSLAKAKVYKDGTFEIIPIGIYVNDYDKNYKQIHRSVTNEEKI